MHERLGTACVNELSVLLFKRKLERIVRDCETVRHDVSWLSCERGGLWFLRWRARHGEGDAGERFWAELWPEAEAGMEWGLGSRTSGLEARPSQVAHTCTFKILVATDPSRTSYHGDAGKHQYE